MKTPPRTGPTRTVKLRLADFEIRYIRAYLARRGERTAACVLRLYAGGVLRAMRVKGLTATED